MAAARLARVFSRSNTTLLRNPPAFLRPIAVLPNTRPSPIARSLSTEVRYLDEMTFGIDGKHWIIWVKEPQGNPTRDEIIDSYVKLMTTVLGSEEEARMKIYSVSTRHYYAIGALIDEEICSKLRELPQVLSINQDTYIDAKAKDYGGEPFVDGRPVPYDRKYHAAYWAMQEAMYRLPTEMDDHNKDAEIRATDSASPDKEADNKWSIPRAWLSQVGAWWKGPSP